MMTTAAVPRGERGLNMIEVIVALALLATVMLGISTLFVRGGKSVKSGKELTEATSIGTDIMEELEEMSYAQVYGAFGGSSSDTGLTVDTMSNAYASRWQPGIDERLSTPNYQARATITLTPLGGPSSPPTFDSGRAIRILVVVEWEEGQRHRAAQFVTARF
jgi:prepilin-type N-terminal cleavage/methylation domain-containing protein